MLSYHYTYLDTNYIKPNTQKRLAKKLDVLLVLHPISTNIECGLVSYLIVLN